MNTLRLPTTVLTSTFGDRLHRQFIGFDQLFEAMDQLANNATAADTGYPPYNIVKADETHYEIELAVAGFSPEDISISQERNVLTVSSEGRNKVENANRAYIHQGIANRKFNRVFNLQEHVNVTDASFENGILVIRLEKLVPEAMKPRKIEISNKKAIETIEASE
jgi:molecular chaperone IbpA